MLNIVAALFVVFGLIGLFAIVLKYMHNTGRLSGLPFGAAKAQGVIVEPPIILDSKRRILNITHRGQRYTLLLGPNNDILLDSGPVRIVESAEYEKQFEHQQ